MTLLLESEAPPLKHWDDGSIRVGGTRLLLEIVINDYKQGRCAEEIAHSYPPVSLVAIYGAIAYYLNHQTAVDEYLRWVEQESDALQKKLESLDPTVALRNLILARSQSLQSQP